MVTPITAISGRAANSACAAIPQAADPCRVARMSGTSTGRPTAGRTSGHVATAERELVAGASGVALERPGRELEQMKRDVQRAEMGGVVEPLDPVGEIDQPRHQPVGGRHLDVDQPAGSGPCQSARTIAAAGSERCSSTAPNVTRSNGPREMRRPRPGPATASPGRLRSVTPRGGESSPTVPARTSRSPQPRG